MLQGKDIIVFANEWGRHPSSCQHLMTQLLEANRILWVNTIGMRRPKLSLYDIKRAAGKILSWVKPKTANPVEIPKHLNVISPLMIPYNDIAPIRRINRQNVISAVHATSRELGFRDPILVTAVPLVADYVGDLGESLCVYYCMDDYAEWPGAAKEMLQELELDLVRKADVVVAVSDRLVEMKQPLNPATHLLTHGVDVEHFASAQQVTEADVRINYPSPVLGYYGLIDERTDQSMLADVLAARPDWTMVFIGNARVSLESLERFPNFHHVGPVPYDKLPLYAAGFDVAIIPYILNELSMSINPLKLKEYLATGVPVVSTPLPEAVRLNDWIHVADSAETFISSVEAALREPRDTDSLMRFLQTEAWSAKAETLSRIISSALPASSDRK